MTQFQECPICVRGVWVAMTQVISGKAVPQLSEFKNRTNSDTYRASLPPAGSKQRTRQFLHRARCLVRLIVGAELRTGDEGFADGPQVAARGGEETDASLIGLTPEQIA